MMINNKTWEKFLKSGPKQTSAISASIQYSAETSSKCNRKTEEVEELRGWGKLFFFFLWCGMYIENPKDFTHKLLGLIVIKILWIQTKILKSITFLYVV